MGELLALTKENGERKRKGGNGRGNNVLKSHRATSKVTLSDLGIKRNKSARLQQIAALLTAVLVLVLLLVAVKECS